MRRLTTAAELAAAVATPRFLLFKHSTRCPISAAAFEEWQEFERAHPAAPTAWIDVIEQRDLVRDFAARTRVKHESPQALLFVDGKVAWHAAHGEITSEALASAVAASAPKR
jgi:bacillithiol system protein YtxJ